YRSSHRFHAPTLGWNAAQVGLVAPHGASVSVDGIPVLESQWLPIGESGYSHCAVILGDTPGGMHEVVADQEVGVSVFVAGFGTAHWFTSAL
ncbi:MAG TPA: hypothetical protein VM869_02255, partial [Enhygromyxa sp.]|nr:hypothetical protein [Enhygromyxa sp.]